MAGFDPSMMDPSMMAGLFESPMVTNVAFHPRPAEPEFLNSSGRIRDGTFDVSGGEEKIAYRLILPDGISPEDVPVIIFHFHGNAELCTDVSWNQDTFGQAALISIDYRGYGWGTGNPSLGKLCKDAEDCFAGSDRVLGDAGLQTDAAKRIVWGRSIGATCAVHLAAKFDASIHGLVVDSGLMSIKSLPMVAMLAQGMLGPNASTLLQMVPEPFDTPSKLPSVACPTLVMHGDLDEIVPVAQGVLCHAKCGSGSKKFVRWPDVSHNDVHIRQPSEWSGNFAALVAEATSFTNPFPIGTIVETHSLSAAAMNGKQGSVAGPKGERVRVAFPEPMGTKAIKPINLKVIQS